MSLDLYQEESMNDLNSRPVVGYTEPEWFHNFIPGTGKVAMQSLSKVGRAVDLAGAVGPILYDKFAGGTEQQDKYFKEHDEIFNRAVDYWSPKKGEVGLAGDVVGNLIGTLPFVIASPALAVGAQQLSVAEDLQRQGVSSEKAQAVGAVQAASLGLGIWMPILGKNAWQRIGVGGVGFNTVQGVATRATSGAILEGTPQSEQFKSFDGRALTLDVLLGAAFGTLAHLSPGQRAQGEEMWTKIQDWAEKLSPSQKDAIATLRQAQHLNVDSMPGKPVGVQDIEAHVTRMRAALGDLVNDRPVNIEGLPEPKFSVDPERVAQTEQIITTLQREIAVVDTSKGQITRAEGLTQNERVIAPEKVIAETQGKVQGLREDIQPSKALDQYEVKKQATSGEPTDPVTLEAQRFVSENPDIPIRVGEDANGNPITKTAKEYMDDTRAQVDQARVDAGLFEIAARCLLGGGA